MINNITHLLTVFFLRFGLLALLILLLPFWLFFRHVPCLNRCILNRIHRIKLHDREWFYGP